MNSIKSKIFFVVSSLLVSVTAFAELPTCNVSDWGDGATMCICAGDKLVGCSTAAWFHGADNQDKILERVQKMQGLVCNGYEPVEYTQCNPNCGANGTCGSPSRAQ